MSRTSSRRVRILKSKPIYKGRLITVRRDTLLEPGGVRTVRELVVHPGSVVVLPVLPDGRILLIRQYRHAAGQFLWELVAGKIDSGETALAAARRELQEETGYSARRLRKLLDFYSAPGFVTERLTLFLAEGLTKGAASPDVDERILPRAFRPAQLARAIHANRIQDAKSLVGLLFYLSCTRQF